MARSHPLLDADVVSAVERAATAYAGRPWRPCRFTDLDDRASHPAGILHGTPADGTALDVFAKLETGPDANVRVASELAALRLLHEIGRAPTPQPLAPGPVPVSLGGDVEGSDDPEGGAALLLLRAVRHPTTGPPAGRSAAQWRDAGRTLARLHAVRGARFGFDPADPALAGRRFDPLPHKAFFGPLPQDNRPVPGAGWPRFWVERRLLPMLDRAVASGHLEGHDHVAADLERLAVRVGDGTDDRTGPAVVPALVHGDAQQNNLLATPDGTVLVDPAPCFGHPEADLALVDYFEPADTAALLAGYREVGMVDPGFDERRELWRLPVYLAVLAVTGGTAWGRQFHVRLADAARRYR